MAVPPLGVLFDLFETLITEPPLAAEAHPRARIGCPDAFDEVWAASRHRRMTTRARYEEVLLRVFETARREPDRVLIASLVAARRERKAALLTQVPPEIVAMLQRLRAAGARVAVVSNCSVDEAEHWPHSPLASLVDAAVFSCDVGVLKPDAAIYEEALDRIGCDGAHATFLGDGGSDELRGAAAAGIATVYRAAWFVDQVEDRDGRLRARGDECGAEHPVLRTVDQALDALVPERRTA